MRFCLAILTITAIQLQAVFADDSLMTQEVKQLQGKWTWINVDVGDGWRIAESAIANYVDLVIKDDVITFNFKDAGTKWEAKWKFTVDPNTKPKTIDMELLEGDGKDRKMLGIYSIEKGELRICLPTHRDKATRPMSFEIKEADRLFVGTLKKSKK